MERDFSFKILKRSKKSKARLGLLKTPHGIVKTPAFVTVGTKGTVKSLAPDDLEKTGTQMVFVNTYHSVLSPGTDILEKAGGIHQFSGIKKPIITDSGGFQVFSLAQKKRKIKINNDDGEQLASLVKINDEGVEFFSPFNGQKIFFTPEFSIRAQKKIGGDLVVAFDECVYYGASYEYAKKATERTHHWALESLKSFNLKETKTGPKKNQEIYGVIQGGIFRDLREHSAKFISSLPFFGLAIGGVSVGETKKEMREQVSWVMAVISQERRPIHLLGVGELDDVIDMVKMGIDTMDCVIPTRHARMGRMYKIKNQKSKIKNLINLINNFEEIDIFKSRFKHDLNPVDKNCPCYTCQNFSRAYLHHLFKQKELLAYRLATIHNLTFFENFFKYIRDLIAEDKI